MNTNIDAIVRETWIPTAQIGKFKERVSELNKRANRLKCTPISYNVTDEKETVHVPAEQIGGPTGYVQPAYSYETTKVIITGETPKLNGWQVIGKIEHDPELSQNIIFEIGENKLSEDFRTKAGCCDHCRVTRPRNKTYLVKKDDEIKQVGSTCLKDFTGHQNPENACHIAFFIDESMDELSSFGNTQKGYIMVEPYLHYVAQSILTHGYVSAKRAEEERIMSTADIGLEAYLEAGKHPSTWAYKELHPPTPSAIDLTTKALDFIKALDRDKYDNYVNNLITFAENGIIKEKYYRYLASSIVFYQKELAKQAQKDIEKTSQHIGNIGEKITLNATLKGYTSYETDFGTKHVYIFKDNEGNKLVWKSQVGANIDIDEEYKITATIKEHDFYRDVAQTNIIRPKFEVTKELITDDLITETKRIAEQLGDFKGQEVLAKCYEYFEEKKGYGELEKFAPGIRQICTYLSFSKNDKIDKLISDLNTHQILLLANLMRETGYTIYQDTQQTRKFFKNNKDIINKIETMYKEPVIKKTRRTSKINSISI